MRETPTSGTAAARLSRIDAGRQNCFAHVLLEGGLVAVDLADEWPPTRFDIRPGKPRGL